MGGSPRVLHPRSTQRVANNSSLGRAGNVAWTISAAARDGNEIPSPPSSTYTEYRESGKLLRFKGAELSYGLSPSLQECLSTLALSEFLLPLDLLPFLPYLVILFCAATKLAAASPPMLPLVYFFSISILYTDNFFPVLVFITLFTSIVLLEPTRSPNPKRATGF